MTGNFNSIVVNKKIKIGQHTLLLRLWHDKTSVLDMDQLEYLAPPKYGGNGHGKYTEMSGRQDLSGCGQSNIQN